MSLVEALVPIIRSLSQISLIFFILEKERPVTGELIDLYKECKRKECSRQDFLRKAACIPGMYVPSLYEVTYHEDGTIAERKKLVPEIPEM